MAKIFPAKMWAVVPENYKSLSRGDVYKYKTQAKAECEALNYAPFNIMPSQKFKIVPVIVSLEEENNNAV